MKKLSDRYLKVVEWSEKDDCYIGTCPGLFIGGVHGKDEAKTYKELCEAVDDVIKTYDEDRQPLPEATNKEYSGKFNLRVGKELHRKLVLKALRAGESLNNFCLSLLKRA